MLRINSRTVELTNVEMLASALFEIHLDLGYGIHDAIEATKVSPRFADLDPAFWNHLRGVDTSTVLDKAVRLVKRTAKRWLRQIRSTWNGFAARFEV